MLRAVSIALLVAAWYLGSEFAGERMLPGPLSVLSAILTEARSGTLFMDLAVTLARVTLAFLFALAAGSVYRKRGARMLNSLSMRWRRSS